MNEGHYTDKDVNCIFEELFCKYSDPILVIDERGNILLSNEAMQRIVRKSRYELIGKNYEDFDIFVKKSLELIKTIIPQIINGTFTEIFEISIQDGSNALQYFEVNPGTIQVQKERPVVYLTFRDITKHKTLEKERMQELLLAKMVQESVLSPPLKKDHIAIEGKYLPAQNIGGDMYVWCPIDEYRYGVVLFDVMGHSISSSLVGMSIRALLTGIIKKTVDPVIVMTELNKHMHQLFHQQVEDIPHYFTGIYLLIDTKVKTIEYINAGHPPGILLGHNHSIIPLPINSVPIGLVLDVVFKKKVLSYLEGSKILLYTDGLIQQSSHQSIYCIITNFLDFIQQYSFSDDQSLIDYILERRHEANKINDDICLVEVTL